MIEWLRSQVESLSYRQARAHLVDILKAEIIGVSSEYIPTR